MPVFGMPPKKSKLLTPRLLATIVLQVALMLLSLSERNSPEAMFSNVLPDTATLSAFVMTMALFASPRAAVSRVTLPVTVTPSTLPLPPLIWMAMFSRPSNTLLLTTAVRVPL